MRAWWQRDKADYRRLTMHCAPGTHAAAFALLSRHATQRDGALDLAAGSGAFLARLRDHGFRDLHAIELDTAQFGVEGICPLAIDLNGEFARHFDRRFALIVALEIIEHLDAPRHFLHEVHQLLDADGHLLLSTPNVANWIGRVTFLLRGELRFFAEKQYHQMRHISPLTHTQLRMMLREVGFEILDDATSGDFAGPLKKFVTAPLWLTFRALQGSAALGDAHIYLARRTASDQRSPGRQSGYSIGRTRDKTAEGRTP